MFNETFGLLLLEGFKNIVVENVSKRELLKGLSFYFE